MTAPVTILQVNSDWVTVQIRKQKNKKGHFYVINNVGHLCKPQGVSK